MQLRVNKASVKAKLTIEGDRV